VRTQGACYFYGSICCGEVFGLLLAKGCDRIAALTTCKQKHALQLSALTLNCGHVLWFDKESGPETSPKWVLGKVTEKITPNIICFIFTHSLQSKIDKFHIRRVLPTMDQMNAK
jgi:hypothetical protein